MLGVEGGTQQRGQQGNLRGGRHSSGSPSEGSLEQVRRSTSAAGLKHTCSHSCAVCYRDMYSVDGKRRAKAPPGGELKKLWIHCILKLIFKKKKKLNNIT